MTPQPVGGLARLIFSQPLSLGAQAGKFGNFHVDMVIPARVWVGEGFQRFIGLRSCALTINRF